MKVTSDDNKVNLADLMFSLLDLNNKANDTLTDFILGMPIQEVSEEVFKQYFISFYPKLKQFTSYDLNYLLDIVSKYKNNEVIEGFTDNLKPVNKMILINGKKLPYYAKAYDLNYNMVYVIYNDLVNSFNFTYDRFIKALEEKRDELVQRRNKNKN